MILQHKFTLPVQNSFILSISPTGEMIIIIEKLNFLYLIPEFLNSSNIEIYIEPTLENNKYKNLNFTWETKTIKQNEILIQLNFSDPTQISPFISFDEIVFTTLVFNETSLKYEDSNILGNKIELKSKICP